MPTREEIVGYIKELLIAYNESTINPSNELFKLDAQKAEMWLDRIAQVEAMRCESCINYILNCHCKIYGCVFGSNEGCFHHEPKV